MDNYILKFPADLQWRGSKKNVSANVEGADDDT